MVINSDTKIAAILKQHPDALEAIISIDQKFGKLRNPLLRKLMAGRTSIAMASKIAGTELKISLVNLSRLALFLRITTKKKKLIL